MNGQIFTFSFIDINVIIKTIQTIINVFPNTKQKNSTNKLWIVLTFTANKSIELYIV